MATLESIKADIDTLNAEQRHQLEAWLRTRNGSAGHDGPPRTPLGDEPLEDIIRRRWDEIQSGEVETISGEEVWQKIRDKYGYDV